MSKTLLLADDSVTMQKVVGITFANEDVELVTVDNGDDALNRAREIRPDLVLADVGMPGLDGYSLCAALKSEPTLAHVKVILLTGTFDMYDEARAAEVGADAHVSKPFEAQALVEQVRQLLARPTGPAKRPPAGGPAAASPRGAASAPAAEPDLSDPARSDFDLDFGDLDFEAAGNGTADTAFAPPPPTPSPAAASAARGGARLPADDDRRFGQTMLLEDPEESELVEGEMVEEAWPPGGPPPLPHQPPARGASSAASLQESLQLGTMQRPDPSSATARGRATPAASGSLAAPAAERDPRASAASAPSASRSPRRPEPAAPEAPAELGDELWEIGGPPAASASAARRNPRAPEATTVSPAWAEPLDEDTEPPRAAARKPSPPPPAPAAAAARSEPSAADREAIRETLEKVAWDAFGNLSEQIVREVVTKVEQIAWEVIPVLSERLIREEIARLKGEDPR